MGLSWASMIGLGFLMGDSARLLSQGCSLYLKPGAVSQLWSHP